MDARSIQELIKAAKKVKTVEELILLARENGIELSDEKAQEYYLRLHPVTRELADEELNNVAAGCGSPDVKPPGKDACPRCGSTDVFEWIFGVGFNYVCNSCLATWYVDTV